MLGRSRRQALLLERHWRSLARHRAADAPSGLDPDLAETVADLARCAERLRPDARAIDATRHQLAAHTREASERRAWTGPARRC